MAKKIISMVLTVIVVFSMFSLVGCNPKASSFTEEEHMERVSKLVEKRYMEDRFDEDWYKSKDSEYEYTGYTIFPLYNQNDELTHFLVEFEPYGFVYILIREKEVRILNYVYRTMYVRSDWSTWRRYTVTEELKENNGQEYIDMVKHYETDENGDYIYYKNSHYKEAGIEGEKRYLLDISNQLGERSAEYIPAVKRGDEYLNLVSMEKFDIALSQEEAKKQATSNIGFIADPYFNL